MSYGTSFINVLLISSILLVLVFMNLTSVKFDFNYDSYGNTYDSQTHYSTSYNLHSKIPLQQLVGELSPSDEALCEKRGGKYFHDTILPESVTHTNRKIPRIIHFTSRTRCLSNVFHATLSAWRLTNHSVYLHDEDAIDRLMFRKWNMFPHLQEVMKCIGAGAEKADLWRYLVMWEYGGIYSDIDNSPGEDMLSNITIIKPDDDSFFLPDAGAGFPSQWFFAASPSHPVFYFTTMQTLLRLSGVPNLSDKYIPFVTGPGALKVGMIEAINNGYPEPGVYNGVDNCNVTILDNRNHRIVVRESVRRDSKSDGLIFMNMSKYGDGKEKRLETYSCLHLLYYQRNNKLKPEDARFGKNNV